MSECVSVKDWEYRGEGGANLVIRVPSEDRVLRFAKSKYVEKTVELKVAEMVVYANEILRPLIGHVYVRPLHLSVLEESDFDRIRVEVQPFRPTSRLKKDVASNLAVSSHDCALLTKSYAKNTVGNSLSFEIKPKQGWKSNALRSGLLDLCSRCLKQKAKVLQKELEMADPYCPLDLFSGELTRMTKAINDLVLHPGNKFKVFKNAVPIYNEDVGNTAMLEHEINHFLHSGRSTEDADMLLSTSIIIS